MIYDLLIYYLRLWDATEHGNAQQNFEQQGQYGHEGKILIDIVLSAILLHVQLRFL